MAEVFLRVGHQAGLDIGWVVDTDRRRIVALETRGTARRPIRIRYRNSTTRETLRDEQHDRPRRRVLSGRNRFRTRLVTDHVDEFDGLSEPFWEAPPVSFVIGD